MWLDPAKGTQASRKRVQLLIKIHFIDKGVRMCKRTKQKGVRLCERSKQETNIIQ